MNLRGIERLADAVLKRAVRDEEQDWLLHDDQAAFWIRASGRDVVCVRQRIEQRWGQMARQAASKGATDVA